MMKKKSMKLLKCAITISVVLTNILFLQGPTSVHALGGDTSSTPIEKTMVSSKDGGLRLTNSSIWLDTSRTKAQMNLELNTDLFMIEGRPKQDIIFVIDESGSMKGQRMEKVKQSLLESPKTLLAPELDNRVALIGFTTTKNLVKPKDITTTHCNFTNNQNTFENAVNSLRIEYGNPYISGLNQAKSLFENRSDKSRKPVLIFMSDGEDKESVSSIKSAANQLAQLGTEMYVVQYMQGSTVSNQLKAIATGSKYIYNAPDVNSVVDIYRKVIGEVRGITREYKDITIEIPFDNGNFEIEKISPTIGTIKQEGNILKWTIPQLTSGYDANAAINIKLSDENYEGHLFVHNEGNLKISAQDLAEQKLKIESPTLTRNFYKVQYEGNGNTGGSTPADDKVIGLDTYEIPDNPSFLSKKGEVFNGWQREDTGEVVTRRIVMPEKDIKLKAVWGKVSIEINTSTAGSVNTMNTNALRSNFTNYASITQVEFVNNIKEGTTVKDLSKNKDGSIVGWLEGTKLYVGSPETIYLPEDASNLFNGFSNATEINFNGLVSSYYTTNMSNMFEACSKLTGLALDEFDTSKVTNMNSMFRDCNELTTLDVSNFITSQVTDMRFMFLSCNKLANLNASNFDTSKVTDMSSMFSGCSSLTILDISNFITSEVTTMQGMFYGCERIITLGISSFDTSNVSDMSAMFSNCKTLTTLDISNFKTSKVTTMSDMFYSCERIITLDLSHFDTSNVDYMNNMFMNCKSLKNLNVSNFKTNNVGYMNNMFTNCIMLTLLDLSSFDTSKVTYYRMDGFFQNCTSLTTVYARTQNDVDCFKKTQSIPGNVNVIVKTTRSTVSNIKSEDAEVRRTTNNPVSSPSKITSPKAITNKGTTVEGGRINMGDIIDYEITVQYTATAAVKSKVLSIKNRLPDGMSYVTGSEVTNPPVRIVAGDGGLASGDIYDINIEGEVLTFKVKNLSAGCLIKLNYQAKAPSSVPDGYQEFLNQATVSVEEVTESSNYVRHYIGMRTKPLYNLSYVYDGTAASDAPDLPTSMQYTEGQKINVTGVGMPGYIFNGWKVNGVLVDTETYIMPNQDVEMIGSWTKLTDTNALKAKVSYEYTGDIPEGVTPPKEVEYTVGSSVGDVEKVSGKTVYLQDEPILEDGYTFKGWTSDNITSEEINNKEFVLGKDDIVIYGEWVKDSYKVKYEYIGDTPADAPALPSEETYKWGEEVETAKPLDTLKSYIFDGWYSNSNIDADYNESFTMPKEDVTLFALWGTNPYTITYKQVGDIPKDVKREDTSAAYASSDGIVWMAPETSEITNNEGVLGVWTFDGWTSNDITFNDDGTYVMPDKDIEIIGKWSFKEDINVRRVTFKIENGTWEDGSNDDINIVVILVNGKTTLDSQDVPTGMKANLNYGHGEWSLEPNTNEGGITDNVTYSYHFKKEENVKVKFEIKNGTWEDGSNEAKEVEVLTLDGKGTLDNKDVPTGMKANQGYIKGKWNVEPNTTKQGITESITYIYTFEKKIVISQETSDKSPSSNNHIVTGDNTDATVLLALLGISLLLIVLLRIQTQKKE